MHRFLLSIICFYCFFAINNRVLGQNKTVFNHAAIFVTDLQKSTHFYTKIIGLDTLPEPFHDGKHAWLDMGNNIALHIIQGATEQKNYYKNQHLCFSVHSVPNFTQKLKAEGIRFEDVLGLPNSMTTRIDGVHQIWFQDPDKYWIEVNDAKTP